MMRKDLQTKLHGAFPLLYKLKPKIECWDGWYDLLYKLSEQIESLIQVHPVDDPCVPCAAYIEENWGALYFDIAFCTDEILQHINAAENLSEETCEGCGKPGRIKRRIFGYDRNICLNCFIRIKKEYDDTD